PEQLSCNPHYQKISMDSHKKIALLFISCFLSVFATAQNFDINLLKKINLNESSFKNNYFKATAQSVIVFNIAAPTGVLVAGLINHDKKMQKDAAYMAGGFLVSAIIAQGMKRIIQRDRPFITYSYIIKRDAGGGYSMPSGHTTAAFCTATSLSLLFPKWYVIAPCYLYAASVGYARMYLGVHYPTDVLVGAIVGSGTAWLAYKAEKWMNKKHTDHNTATTVSL
ncbi:MAG: phosphatase PAP2 family protein, partial [Ferruginibacter sp.]